MPKRYFTAWLSVILLLLLSSCSLPKFEPNQDNTPPEVPTEVSEPPTEEVPEAPTVASEVPAAASETQAILSDLPTTDVAYGKNPENLLDVYLPAGSGPFPVVLLIHGTDVQKNYFEGTLTTADLVDNGYAAVSIHYRAPVPGAPIVAMQDATCAFAWIYANSSKYPFKQENIILLGHSRGASMAALMTTMDDLRPLLEGCEYTLPVANGIRAAVTYGGSYGSPEVSFSDPTFVNALRPLSRLGDEELQSWFDMLSSISPNQWRSAPEIPDEVRLFASYLPLAWLDGSEAPFLVVHGEIDEIAPVAEAQVFAAALQNAGVPTTLAILPGMYHRLNQEALHDPLFKFLTEVTAATE